MQDDRHQGPRGDGSHEDAIAQAEARRLLHALAPFMILSREALEHECGAANWHDGGFAAGLRAAIASGLIEELPGGFYRDARATAHRSPPARGPQDG